MHGVSRLETRDQEIWAIKQSQRGRPKIPIILEHYFYQAFTDFGGVKRGLLSLIRFIVELKSKDNL